MWTHALLSGLWGGLMALERRAFLQAMVSRPLVAGTVTGLLLMDPAAGLYVGLVFELLHLGGVSMGVAQADHETLPAVAGAGLAAQMGHAAGSHATPAMWAVAILVCLPSGAAGRLVEGRLDNRARKYFGRAVTAVDAGNFRKAGRQNLRAMWPQFAFYLVTCGAAVVAGQLLAPALQALPLNLVRGVAWAYPAMAAGAAAIAVHGSHARHRFWAAGLAAVGVLLLALRRWPEGA
jgi:mannose/fructose/N-acetylgalactosamine-specific phosphotransferase system component IIC